MPAPDLQHEIEQAARHHEAGRLRKAAALYRRALHQAPDHPRVLHALGVLAYQVGRHDAAPALLRRAVAADPSNPHFHLDLGHLHFARGQFAQAVGPYRQAARLAPDDPSAHARLGAALGKLGMWQEAAEAYARAVELGGVAKQPPPAIRINPDAAPVVAAEETGQEAGRDAEAARPAPRTAGDGARSVEAGTLVTPTTVPPGPPAGPIYSAVSAADGLVATADAGAAPVIAPDGLPLVLPVMEAAMVGPASAIESVETIAPVGPAAAEPAAAPAGPESIRLEPLDSEAATWLPAAAAAATVVPPAAPGPPLAAVSTGFVSGGDAEGSWTLVRPAETIPVDVAPPVEPEGPQAAPVDEPVVPPAEVAVSAPAGPVEGDGDLGPYLDRADGPPVWPEPAIEAVPAPPAEPVPPDVGPAAPEFPPAEPESNGRWAVVVAPRVERPAAEPEPLPVTPAEFDVVGAAYGVESEAGDLVASEPVAAWQNEATLSAAVALAPAVPEPAVVCFVEAPDIAPAVEPDPPQPRGRRMATAAVAADGSPRAAVSAVVAAPAEFDEAEQVTLTDFEEVDEPEELDEAGFDDRDDDEAAADDSSGDEDDGDSAADVTERDGELADLDPTLDSVAAARQLRRKRRKRRPSGAGHLRRHGAAMLRQRKLDEAVAAFSQLVKLNPRSAKAHRDLGAAYLRDDRLEEAVASLQRALELRPKFADAYGSLGDAYHLQGKLDQAISCYRHVLKLKPTAAKAHSNLLLTLNYHHKLDPKAVFEEHRRWARLHADPLRPHLRPHANDPSPDRKLRIGYVSPDFRRHSVNYFTEPVLARHDRSRFSPFCYSDAIRPDAVTERIAGYCDGWRDVRGMSDGEVADLVRDDRIDVFIDLSGHTGCNRLGAFARKPAPIQVTYLGYPNTTGVPTIDYRLTDGYADPPGQTEHLYVEKLVRLPQSFLCYAPPPGAPPTGEPPCLKSGKVTFGCFNILAKVTPEVMALWAKVLAAVPGSRLVMKDRTGSFGYPARRQYVQDIFRYHGVTADRLDLCGKEPEYDKHLETYARVDVVLDPFPYNGTTTTCEALWMGVPVVTLAGATHVARVGVSILSNLELTDLVAATPEQYVRIAADLARDPDQLLFLRDTLRERMERSPLLDAAGFTRNLEAAYRQMWVRWCGAVVAGAHAE